MLIKFYSHETLIIEMIYLNGTKTTDMNNEAKINDGFLMRVRRTPFNNFVL